MSRIPATYRTLHGLTPELRAEILARRNAVLATINDDGSPHLTELLFYLDGQDRIMLPTPQSTKKVRNIQAHATVTVHITIESGWVSATGEARLIDGEDAARLNRMNRERLLTAAGERTMGLLLAAHEDTTIEITPSRWISWNDGHVLSAITALGGDVDADPPSTWWKDLSEG